LDGGDVFKGVLVDGGQNEFEVQLQVGFVVFELLGRDGFEKFVNDLHGRNYSRKERAAAKKQKSHKVVKGGELLEERKNGLGRKRMVNFGWMAFTHFE
jgi:hypothetical protein